MTISYDQSLSLFRNMVNQKHPPQVGAVNHRTRRQVNEVTSGRGNSRGRGGGGRGGRGGRHGGRGGRGGTRQTRSDSRMITLTDGTQIEYHASFNFPRHIYLKMRQEDRDTLKRERAAYNQNRGGRGGRSEIQELRTQIQELQQQAGTSVAPTDTISVRSQVSQVSTGTSIMGGRNEQAQNRDTRRAAAVISQRHVQTTESKSWTDPPANTTAENECDTNADTCCLGRNFVVLQPTFRTADVYAYDTSIKPIENIPIVTGATAYDDTTSGCTYILVFNEALYYGEKLDHTLINPNQVRSYGIPFWDNPFDPVRSLSIDVNGDFQIPLRTIGTKLTFTSRVPTAVELETCEHIHMTSAAPWNPSDVAMLQATNQGGRTTHPWKREIATVDSNYKRYEYVDASSDDALMDSIDPSLVRLGERLHARQQRFNAQVDTIYDHTDALARRTFVSDERHTKVTGEAIAKKF